MKKEMYDKNGTLIERGNLVDVPPPNDGDIHSNEFVGTVAGFHGDFVSVKDCDDNVFDIEPERLEIV